MVPAPFGETPVTVPVEPETAPPIPARGGTSLREFVSLGSVGAVEAVVTGIGCDGFTCDVTSAKLTLGRGLVVFAEVGKVVALAAGVLAELKLGAGKERVETVEGEAVRP